MTKNIIVEIFIVVLGLFISSTLHASSLNLPVTEFDLKNGMKVLLVERHSVPTFSAYMALGVGSVHETSENRGVAHLLEHMLFKGTETVGTKNYKAEKVILLKIEQVGAELDRLVQSGDADEAMIDALRTELKALQQKHKEYVVKDELSQIYAENGGTGFNAYTSKDITMYQVSLPSNRFELWAALESDRMQNAVLREFYTERDVVREERRRSYEADPSRKMYAALTAAAYDAHPYQHPVIGWASDIETLNLKETRQFLEDYYAPVNTVVAIVGDITEQQCRAMFEKYFADIPTGVPVPPVTVIEPEQEGTKRIHVEFDAEPRVSFAFHKPTLPQPEDYIFDLVSEILTTGRTSRLYKRLVLEKEMVTSISTFGLPGARFANLFVFSAMPKAPFTAQSVEEEIFGFLEEFVKQPIPADEMEKVRNRILFDSIKRLKSNQGLANSLAYFQSVADDWRYLADYSEAVAEIGEEEIRQTVKKYLDRTNMTVVTLGREEVAP